MLKGQTLTERDSALIERLGVLHKELAACHACGLMQGPSVHGPAVPASVMLFGQAPGPHEGKLGKPFAWTAGKTLFRWFESRVGIDEKTFRSNIYITAVARCFPGKAPGGGDRRPDRLEIASCSRFVAREVEILLPKLVIPVGTLATEQVLGYKSALVDVIGKKMRAKWHGVLVDVIPLPHPSGVSPWPKIEPGKTLLAQALTLIAKHPAIIEIKKSLSQ